MPPRIDPKTFERRLQGVLAKVDSDIDKHGWSAMHIFSTGDSIPFTYTVGVARTWGAPEVVIVGLAQDQAHGILTSYAHEVRVRRTNVGFAHGEKSDEFLVGFDVMFLDVPKAERGDYFNMARRYYRERGVKAWGTQQLVWPDEEGRWPWDDGFSYGDKQPVIGAHP